MFEAGLGEKLVEFDKLDMKAEEFCDVLYNVFPKLREGRGFTLFKCTPNSRVLEPLSKLAHSSPEMLKRRVGNARTYIRPLQMDLDLTLLHETTDPDQVILYSFLLQFC